jgi:hypothetical protein
MPTIPQTSAVIAKPFDGAAAGALAWVGRRSSVHLFPSQ